MRSKILQAVYALAVVSILTGVSLADTIRLKDGGIIKGHIVSFTNGSFVVEIGDGSHRRQLTFAANEIQSITFDSQSSPAAQTNRNASYTPPDRTYTPPEKKPDPIPSSPPVVVQSQPKRTQAKAPENMKPVTLNVNVSADNRTNGWTNTGWVVKKGQHIRITGDGKVSLGKGQSSPPSGLPNLEDNQKLLKSVPTGALIAVIGDDNNDFIYVGASRDFTAERDGALFLGVNEGNLNDNSGSFTAKVEILPGEGS
jgi:hypothetical protein